MSKHILSLGAGSVGRRHLRNLTQLGCQVSAMDPRADRLDEAAAEVELQHRYTSQEQALAEAQHFDGLVVSSPPNFHIDQCIAAAKAGLPILLEKPASPTLAEVDRLRTALSQMPKAPPLLMGYTYRWWPPLNAFREKLKSGAVGKLRHARFVMSAHLADWHPWEPYQEFFMSSKELGGGALLDESHFIDLILWFFGMPDRISARVEHISSLDIQTDDNVDMLAVYDQGFRVTMHLDLIGRPHEKYISVMGEQGTLEWAFDPNRVRLGQGWEQKWDEQHYDCERNEMFMGVAREFLEVLDGRRDLTCTIEDGFDALRIVEACRLSSQQERTVKLTEIEG